MSGDKDRDKQLDNKMAVVGQLFGRVGVPQNDYSCAVESTILLHGRMYITERFLCFYSNVFGLEKKIIIPLSVVLHISKANTAMVIPNAITIKTSRKLYVFRSFWDRDSTFDVIEAALANVKASLSAMDGEPSLNDTTLNPHATAAHAASRASTGDIGSSSSGGGLCGHRRRSSTGTESSEVDSEHGDGHGEFVDAAKEDVADDVLLKRESRSLCLKHDVTTVDIEMSLDDFEARFVVDDAPCSWAQYHTANGDEQVKDIEQWHRSEESQTLKAMGSVKQFKYLKVVGLPGLRCTRGTKVQRFKRFGEAGLLVYSSSSVEDVPAAHTFTVEDMCMVRAVSPTRLEVELSFEVKFKSSTMLKYMIESNTNREMDIWLKKFGAHLKVHGESSSVTALSSNSSAEGMSSSSPRAKGATVADDTGRASTATVVDSMPISGRASAESADTDLSAGRASTATSITTPSTAQVLGGTSGVVLLLIFVLIVVMCMQSVLLFKMETQLLQLTEQMLRQETQCQGLR